MSAVAFIISVIIIGFICLQHLSKRDSGCFGVSALVFSILFLVALFNSENIGIVILLGIVFLVILIFYTILFK